MDIRDIKTGKIDTFVGSFMTCLVAAFIIVARPGFLFQPGRHHPIESAAQAAEKMPAVMPAGTHWASGAVLFAIGLFDAGLLGALCISLSTSWALGEVFGWAHSLNKSVRKRVVLLCLRAMLLAAGVVRSCLHRGPKHDHDFRTGDCGDVAAGGPRVPDPAPQRQGADGRVRQYPLAEHSQLEYRRVCHHGLDALWRIGVVSQLFTAGS